MEKKVEKIKHHFCVWPNFVLWPIFVQPETSFLCKNRQFFSLLAASQKITKFYPADIHIHFTVEQMKISGEEKIFNINNSSGFSV
jgi:hypothetical protein